MKEVGKSEGSIVLGTEKDEMCYEEKVDNSVTSMGVKENIAHTWSLCPVKSLIVILMFFA